MKSSADLRGPLVAAVIAMAVVAVAGCGWLARWKGERAMEAACKGQVAARDVRLELKLVDDVGGAEFFAEAANRLNHGSPIRLIGHTTHGGPGVVTLEAVDGGSADSGRRALEAFIAGLALPAGRSVALQREAAGPEGGGSRWRALYLEEPAILTGAQVTGAEVVMESQTGMPSVMVTLDEAGAKIFADTTGANVERRLAIVVDGIVASAPIIKERIAGGKIQITLGAAAQGRDAGCEAYSLAAALDPGR